MILKIKNVAPKENNQLCMNTFSPAETFVLPSASLAERAPMPIDGKTENNITKSLIKQGYCQTKNKENKKWQEKVNGKKDKNEDSILGEKKEREKDQF